MYSISIPEGSNYAKMRFHPADREVERESRKREGNKKGRPVHSRRKLVKLEYHPLLQTLVHSPPRGEIVFIPFNSHAMVKNSPRGESKFDLGLTKSRYYEQRS